MLFKSAHSKALLMIKSHFQSIIRNNLVLTSSASTNADAKNQTSPVKDEIWESESDATIASSSLEKLKNTSNPLTTNNSFSLLYGKFRAISSGVKLFLEELEARQEKFTECQRVTYSSILESGFYLVFLKNFFFFTDSGRLRAGVFLGSRVFGGSKCHRRCE